MTETVPSHIAKALQMQASPRLTLTGYGFTCWGGSDSPRGCGNSIEFEDRDCEDIVPLLSYGVSEHDAANLLAGLAGWCIGHWDGQGHIVCPECREAVWDASPLVHARDVKPILDSITSFARTLGALLSDRPQIALKRLRKAEDGKLGPRRKRYRSKLHDMSSEVLRRMLGHCDHRLLHRPVTGRVGRVVNRDYQRLIRRITTILRRRGEPISVYPGKGVPT